MGKKKFIDKKKAATFRILHCDTAADTAFSLGRLDINHVFVRVDQNPYQCPGFVNLDDDLGQVPGVGAAAESSCKKGPLPDHVRKEILELGLPDDGYNYLIHLREIKNAGGGGSYFENPYAKLDRLPLDVKAYDASKLRINSEAADDAERNAVYTVASTTRTIEVHKVVDPDVLRLLDDSDMSEFGSDVGDLEEDFVVKANLQEEEEEQVGKVDEEGEDNEIGGLSWAYSVGGLC